MSVDPQKLSARSPRTATTHAVAAATTTTSLRAARVAVPYVSLARRLKRETRARVIFDLTDPLWRPIHRGLGWWDVEKILVEADAVFTENRYMSAFAHRYNDRVFDIPPSAQIERFD